MDNQNESKYKGKADSIASKYRYLKFQSYSQGELITLIKELVDLQEKNEKLIQKLERKLEDRKNKIIELSEELAFFNSDSEDLKKYIGYNVDWLYIDKIVFVIERTRKPLTSHQIVNKLIEIEPTLKQKLLNPFNSITKSIYSGVKLNRVIRHLKTGNFGYTYILPQWIIETGVLRKE